VYFCLLVIMLSGSYGVTCTPLSGSATFDGNNSDTNPQPPSSPPPVFTNTSSTSEILLKLGFSFLRNRHPWTVLAIVLRPFSPKHFNYAEPLSGVHVTPYEPLSIMTRRQKYTIHQDYKYKIYNWVLIELLRL
jgi:hypothetical protein